ncbi:MAG: D-aminoacyl-tRNA deacylase [Oligoflexia bacterium]|nr:D-aminoacyl-tRNA deacylase [Oligoflexia bacterium]
MKAVIQRVLSASITVDSQKISKISKGLLVFLGIHQEDAATDFEWMLKKVSQLRIFEDQEQKMNLSVRDINGQILLVSQFTLLADTKKGNRPSFIQAAKPEKANEMYLSFGKRLEADGFSVAYGKFAADMKVELLNDGPVTIILDSKDSQV